jgi:hypothetical protein
MQHLPPPRIDEILEDPTGSRRSAAWLVSRTIHILDWASQEIGSSSQYHQKILEAKKKFSKKPTKNLGDWIKRFLINECNVFLKNKDFYLFEAERIMLDDLLNLKFLARCWFPASLEKTDIKADTGVPIPSQACYFCCRDARFPGDKMPGGYTLFTCDDHAPGPPNRHNAARDQVIRAARRVAARSSNPKRHWTLQWRNVVLTLQVRIRGTIRESRDDVDFALPIQELHDAVIKTFHSAPLWAAHDTPMMLARWLALQTLFKEDRLTTRQATMGWLCNNEEIEHAISRVGDDLGVRETARLTGLHPSTVSRLAKKARGPLQDTSSDWSKGSTARRPIVER